MLAHNYAFVTTLEAIARCRKFVLGSLVFSAVTCALTLFLLPKEHAAKITFLPILANDADSLAAIPTAVFALSNLSERFTERALVVLQSRTIKERVITNLNLMNAYGVKSMAAAVEILKESTKIEKIIGSTISVEAYDHSPQRAADIANEYAKQLHFLAEKYHFVPPKILDTAVPQYLPAKPRISLIVLGILFGCLLANVVVIYLNCFIRDLKEHHPDDFERLLFVQAVVRNDLQKLIFWRKSKDGRKPQTKNHLTSYLAYQPSLASGLLEPKREDGVEV